MSEAKEANEANMRNGADAGEDGGQVGAKPSVAAGLPNDGMSTPIEELRPDMNFSNPRCVMKIASERLSIVRYVFLVQIEDGIATAPQRASLEYADAVLIGWPEEDGEGVVDVDDEQFETVRRHMELMEEYIAKFTAFERAGDVDDMTDTLIRITEHVAEVRRLYQPDFPLPTFAEIRRVVQDEWDEDMGKIDPKDGSPTAEEIERERDDQDREAQQGERA